MADRLVAATEVILPGTPLDVMAFGCTSASMVIGEERVFELIKSVRPGVACTTPITAALAAFRALERAPHRAADAVPRRHQPLHARLHRGARRRVPVMGSFNEEDDRRAARIDVASIQAAAIELGRSPAVDAVFVSCTSLRLLDAIAAIEAELGKPATSSNHAMAWHCLRLAGIAEPRPDCGRLFEQGLER